MPNYANGKIYQIISPNHPVPYIGSTTQPLSKRMVEHRSHHSKCHSRIIIEAGDAYIELIEEFPCENREQLNKREGEIIRERGCVNRVIPGRTFKEWYEVNKEVIIARSKTYHKSNRETVNTQARARHEADKEAINARRRAHHEANREAINARKKAYREANKETINARKKAYRALKKSSTS